MFTSPLLQQDLWTQFCMFWFTLQSGYEQRPSGALAEALTWAAWWTRGWPTVVVAVKLEQRSAVRSICIRAPQTLVTWLPATPPPTTRSACRSRSCSQTDPSRMILSIHHLVSLCLSELLWKVFWRTSSNLPSEGSQLPVAAPHTPGPENQHRPAAVTQPRSDRAQTHHSGNPAKLNMWPSSVHHNVWILSAMNSCRDFMFTFLIFSLEN